MENLHHVFISGPIAIKTWLHFDDVFHLHIYNAKNSVLVILRAWFLNDKGHIRNLTAALILWFLWLERNNSVFNNISMSHHRVIKNVKDKIVKLFVANLISPKNLKNYSYVANYFGFHSNTLFAQKIPRFVHWLKPEPNTFKLNVDACFIGNKVGFGGIVRDYLGKVVFAYASCLVEVSVDFGLLFAIRHGLRFCLSSNLPKVVTELSNPSCFKALSNKEVNFYWKDCFYLFRDSKQMMSNFNFAISLIPKEANAVAGWLAHFGSICSEISEFNDYNLPVKLKALVKLELLGMPYLKG